MVLLRLFLHTINKLLFLVQFYTDCQCVYLTQVFLFGGRVASLAKVNSWRLFFIHLTLQKGMVTNFMHLSVILSVLLASVKTVLLKRLYAKF